MFQEVSTAAVRRPTVQGIAAEPVTRTAGIERSVSLFRHLVDQLAGAVQDLTARLAPVLLPIIECDPDEKVNAGTGTPPPNRCEVAVDMDALNLQLNNILVGIIEIRGRLDV